MGPQGERGPAGPAGVLGYEVVASDPTSVEALTPAELAVQCPDGKSPVGGGVQGALELRVYNSYPQDDAWQISLQNDSTETQTFTVYAICVNTRNEMQTGGATGGAQVGTTSVSTTGGAQTGGALTLSAQTGGATGGAVTGGAQTGGAQTGGAATGGAQGDDVGNLTLVVPVATSYVITGPGGYERSLRGNQELTGLAVGVYRIVLAVQGERVERDVEVTGGETATLDVTSGAQADTTGGAATGGSQTGGQGLGEQQISSGGEPVALDMTGGDMTGGAMTGGSATGDAATGGAQDLGNLNVTIPDDTTFVITGPGGYEQELTGNQELTELEPGVYVITATVSGESVEDEVEVVAGETFALDLR